MKSILKNQKMRVFSLSVIVMSVLLGGIFMQSCSNEDEIDHANLFENPYDYVGKYHNEGLS